MIGKNFQSAVRRIVRVGGRAEAMTRSTGLAAPALDATLVDEVFASAADEAPAATEQPQGSGLLVALRDQLAALESHQSQIRRLIDQVERHATTGAAS